MTAQRRRKGARPPRPPDRIQNSKTSKPPEKHHGFGPPGGGIMKTTSGSGFGGIGGRDNTHATERRLTHPWALRLAANAPHLGLRHTRRGRVLPTAEPEH